MTRMARKMADQIGPDKQPASADQPTGSMLPEWRELDVDDASWIASLEASRRKAFAELADL